MNMYRHYQDTYFGSGSNGQEYQWHGWTMLQSSDSESNFVPDADLAERVSTIIPRATRYNEKYLTGDAALYPSQS